MSERAQILKSINKIFEGREPWQIVTISASSVVAVVWVHSLLNANESVAKRLRKQFYRWLRCVPYVKRQIDDKMAEVVTVMRQAAVKRIDSEHVPVRTRLPEHGLTKEEVSEDIKQLLKLGSCDWSNGNVSGAVYHLNEDINKVASGAYALTAYTNPLHVDVFPGVNKMEAEIVQIAVNLFHGDEQCCGTMTTGGSESIMMACKAFRDLAYSRGISRPQMVVPSTAHTAFDKAAQYLNISIVSVPVSSDTLTVDVGAVRRAISRRTCLIVGSAPNFPYGTWDDIEALSALALEYGVPLHVDACLGGFLAAFMPDAGFPVPPFDFRLPGVCSMSADTHKYGFAPKGTSVVLYRRPEYRHHQYTVTTDWHGGVYGSPTVSGSRAGGLIAACWATMMYVGHERYVQMTKQIIATTKYIEAELRKIDGIFIFGTPATSVIAFGSKRFDIYKLADLMHKRGWGLNTLQFPSGVHFCVTHAHTTTTFAQRFVDDVRAVTLECLADGCEPVQGMMAVYGSAQHIPDRSLVSDVIKHFIDAMYYLPKGEKQEVK